MLKYLYRGVPMTYFESKEVASRLDISIRRIQQMCKSGEIDGAKKESGSWLVPKDFIDKNMPSNSKKSLFLSEYLILRKP